MSKRTASWLAWSLGALWLALFAANITLSILTRSAQAPTTWGTSGLVTSLLTSMPFLAFPIVGALIASRRPNNPIGWICLASGIFWVLLFLSGPYGVYGLVVNPGSVPLAAQIGAFAAWLWAPAGGLVGIYLPLLFPDGRLPSRRWRPLAWFAGALILLVSATTLLAPGPVPELGEGVPNPFGLESQPWLAEAAIVLRPLFFVCFLASALSLILRYRRSGGEEREQIKWLAFAASLVGLLLMSSTVSTLIFVPEAFTGTERPLWLALLQDAVAISATAIPVAVGFAVLKYRLYEIDLIINRTLVYGLLTATLALLYFGSVTALQSLFSLLTGQGNTLAIVASTLAIAALFNPLRRRIQSFIDRRFYRRKYDAAKILEAFGTKLRDQTDLERISEDLAEVVDETMQPAHVSVILRSEVPSSSTREQGQQEDQQTARHEED
jgi:MFS family permease